MSASNHSIRNDMEPASLAFAVAGLAVAFESAVETFIYVRVAAHFKADFKMATVKLNIARLRLSRWGQALGLEDEDAAGKLLMTLKVSREDFRSAEELLKQIVGSIGKAEKVTKTYQTADEPDESRGKWLLLWRTKNRANTGCTC
jgi:hypothetical protein